MSVAVAIWESRLLKARHGRQRVRQPLAAWFRGFARFLAVLPHEHVVMISIDEYHSLAETEYLLSEEANARHLRDSLRAARSGGARRRQLSED